MRQSRDIGVVFDELADGYTRMMEDMVPHYRQLITAMLEYLPADFVPRKVMDLGCGNGNVTALCKAVFPDAQYHLVDASAEMIRECRERFGNERTTYEQAFFQELELTGQSYDLMIAGFSFHHVPAEDKRTLFKPLRKALTPGGYLTTADLFVNKADEPAHSQVMQGWQDFVLSNGRTLEDWEWLQDHYAKYDRPSAFVDQQRWLREAGFSTVEQSWNDGSWGCFHAS